MILRIVGREVFFGMFLEDYGIDFLVFILVYDKGGGFLFMELFFCVIFCFYWVCYGCDWVLDSIIGWKNWVGKWGLLVKIGLVYYKILNKDLDVFVRYFD